VHACFNVHGYLEKIKLSTPSGSSVCIAGVARLHGDLCRCGGGGGLLVVPGRTPLPALYWATDKDTRSVDRSLNRLQQGNLSLVDYNSCHIPSICFRRNPPRSCLVRRVLRS
jgi:hypothetical protein